MSPAARSPDPDEGFGRGDAFRLAYRWTWAFGVVKIILKRNRLLAVENSSPL